MKTFWIIATVVTFLIATFLLVNEFVLKSEPEEEA